MVIACWTAKGGSGATVVAASLALLLARREPAGAVLCDLGGDAPICIGAPPSDGPGITDLLGRLDDAPPDALGQLLVEAMPGLRLLPKGDGALVAGAGPYLLRLLDQLGVPVVVDVGEPTDPERAEIARCADRSVLVIRPCYLALRRCLALSFRPSEVVVLDEPGRAIRPADIEAALDIPVLAVVPVDPAVARAVDAGLLASRLPRRLERALSRAA